MITLDIKEENGFLIMDDFPENCIFNKVKTGCGATTIALTNNQNYIIVVPTTDLVINKCYPSKDEAGNDLVWKKSEIVPGVSPVNPQLFGLYGKLTTVTKTKLKKFLNKEGVKKIICTYDKTEALISLINPQEFKLLTDEYHDLFKQYLFRHKAINGVLDHYNKFKSYCFLSATPISEFVKPNIFKDMIEYVANWKSIDKISIYPYKSGKAYEIAAKIIKQYQDIGYFVLDGVKSEEAYFFVNSVREIKKILDKTTLTNDDCRIICADDEKNHYKLEDFEISNSASKPKRFTFVTCKAFEGVDFHSDTALCFIVSNGYNEHTLISVDMDIPQIAGRIRTKTNPFKNKIVHIFNPKKVSYYVPLALKKQELDKELAAAEERVQKLNEQTLGKDAQKQQDAELKKLGANTYIVKRGDKYEVDDMVGKLKLYIYWTTHIIYRSAEALQEAYETFGSSVVKGYEWDIADEDIMKNILKPKQFRDYHKRFCDLKNKGAILSDREKQELETISTKHPILVEGYDKLDNFKRIREKKNIEAALEELKES